MTEAGPRQLPFVSIVVETSNWERRHRIHLEDTLAAIAVQTYPADRIETIVILDEPNQFEHDRIALAFPWLTIIDAPTGMTYYEFKNFGARRTKGDIIVLTDADCLPVPTWIEEFVRTFETAPANVGVVQGKTRFLHATMSRAWDSTWWSRAFEDEGRIDRLYTSNNLAFRREVFLEHGYIEGTGFKAGLERPLTRELHAAGFETWLNPRAECTHNYLPKLREIVQQGLVRGFNWMSIRRTFPGPGDRRITRLGPISPLVGVAGMYVNDVRRVVGRAGRMGIEAYRVPLYLLALIPFDAVALVGMYWAIIRPRQIPRRPL